MRHAANRSRPFTGAHGELPAQYQTELLSHRDRSHLDRVATLIAQGEIVAFGFNGIFAFLGDADQPVAAHRMAAAKGQSAHKPLALVCAPECLYEFVDTAQLAIAPKRYARIVQLQRMLHGLGVILPAASHTLPRYAMQGATVLNVWFELPPQSPARYLHQRLRTMGVRTMLGTSANQHGEPTYSEVQHVQDVFGGRIAAIVSHDLDPVNAAHRMSSTIVDFTGEQALLCRHGSVPLAELRAAMRQLGLGELLVPAPRLAKPGMRY